MAQPAPLAPLRRAAGRALDAGFVAAFASLWCSAAWRVLEGGSALGLLLGCAASLPAALLVADLASGFVHWFADTFFEADSPWIGRWLIAPFRDHHRHPASILSYGSVESIGSACLLASVPTVVLLLLPAPMSGPARAAHAFALVVLLLSALTNLAHRWAHTTRAPRAVVWLQRRGVLISPRAHARHHRGAFDRGYCVATDWLNPWLDRRGVFPALERGLRRAARPFPVRRGAAHGAGRSR